MSKKQRKVYEEQKPKKKIKKDTVIMAVIIVAMVLAAVGIVGYDKMDTYSKLDYDKYVKVGKYKELKGAPEKVSVSDKEVQKEIKSRINKKAKTKTVKTGKVKEGDTLIIDYEGSIDGKKFDGGTAEKQTLKIGSDTMIPGFEDALIGKTIGKECSIDVTFPKDYGNEELNGKGATFKINIRGKKVKEKIPYDMAFVKSVSDCKSKKEYEASVKKELYEDAKKHAEQDFENELWQKVLDNTKVKKYPKELLAEEVQSQKVYYEQMAQQYGMTAEQMGANKDTYKTIAKQSLKEKLAFHAIAKKEHLRVNSKDKEEYYEELLDDVEMSEKQFKKATGMSVEDYVHENGYDYEILKNKVMKYIADNAVSK